MRVAISATAVFQPVCSKTAFLKPPALYICGKPITNRANATGVSGLKLSAAEAAASVTTSKSMPNPLPAALS
jgi:hypothetical protein